MKSKRDKREVLESVVKIGSCKDINCEECPYDSIRCHDRFFKIGVMALLRMFPEKKKHLLSVGTKIKFSDGKIATIVFLRKEYCLMFESHIEKFYYLVGRSWDVVE